MNEAKVWRLVLNDLESHPRAFKMSEKRVLLLEGETLINVVPQNDLLLLQAEVSKLKAELERHKELLRVQCNRSQDLQNDLSIVRDSHKRQGELNDRVHAQLKEAEKVVERLSKYLNDEIAVLECESRVRTMQESTWETGMYLRDVCDEYLQKRWDMSTIMSLKGRRSE